MLGHHIAIQAKLHQHEIASIQRKGSDLSKITDLKCENRTADLNDRGSLIKAFEGLDYVVNAAAYYPTLPKPLAEEIKQARLQMQFFIDAVKAAGIKKALYVGGAIAIPKVNNGLADETGVYENAPENNAPYVQVKWLMDKMARDAAAQGSPRSGRRTRAPRSGHPGSEGVSGPLSAPAFRRAAPARGHGPGDRA